MSGIPHEEQYVRFFNGAIVSGSLKKVPFMLDSEVPRLVIVVACGHASHGTDRYPHIWQHVTPLTQLYAYNGGGVVLDPLYAGMNREHDLKDMEHAAAHIEKRVEGVSVTKVLARIDEQGKVDFEKIL